MEINKKEKCERFNNPKYWINGKKKEIIDKDNVIKNFNGVHLADKQEKEYYIKNNIVFKTKRKVNKILNANIYAVDCIISNKDMDIGKGIGFYVKVADKAGYELDRWFHVGTSRLGFGKIKHISCGEFNRANSGKLYISKYLNIFDFILDKEQ